jgi:hypothetical protein
MRVGSRAEDREQGGAYFFSILYAGGSPLRSPGRAGQGRAMGHRSAGLGGAGRGGLQFWVGCLARVGV